MSNQTTARKRAEWPDSASVSSLASVGAPGEDRRKPDHQNCGVSIGERTVVREFVTINGGFEATTKVGADCYVMSHAHIGHDCVVHDDVTLATRATLGGHTIVHEGANVGLGAITHQRVTIGAYAMVGAGAVVIRDVPPFATVVGNPARVIGFNSVGMARAGFSALQMAAVAESQRLGFMPDATMRKWFDAFDRDAGRHK